MNKKVQFSYSIPPTNRPNPIQSNPWINPIRVQEELGRSAALTFYFGTPFIFRKLKELMELKR